MTESKIGLTQEWVDKKQAEDGPEEPGVFSGHFTKYDPIHGYSHSPMTAEQAQDLWNQIKERDRKRAELMPDEQSAISMMFEARTRLMELGWRDAIYCPKDGTTFDALEPGCTAIQACFYEGEWPNGTYWASDECDMYPSHPVLFRLRAKKP